MSGMGAMESPASAAMDIEECASLWLQRRNFWNWSDEDQAELDAWLAVSLAHRVAYVRLEAAWKRSRRLAALKSPASSREAMIGRRVSLKAVGTIAALALFIAGGAVLLSGAHEETYATAVGGHRTVALGDGSQIELGTDTILRVTLKADRRTAWLDRGEAYFQIRHDIASPFVVMMGDRRVTDLGTKFFIRRDIERLEVALVEGRVRFDATSGNGQPPAMLKPGDEIVATANTMFVTRQSPRKLTSELGWRHGVLMFDNTTLADAAAEFNRYNQLKLVVTDPAVARLTIDGTFPTGDVQAFTAVAQHILGLHTEHYGDEIVISR